MQYEQCRSMADREERMGVQVSGFSSLNGDCPFATGDLPGVLSAFRDAVNDMGLGNVQNVCFDVWSVVMSTEDCDRMQ